MSVAQAIYTYVKSVETYKDLEKEDSVRQQEINALISQYDYQQKLENQVRSIIKGISVELGEERTHLLSTISGMEKNLTKLSSELEGTKKHVQSNNQNVTEKKTLEKQISELKHQLDREKLTAQRIEKDKSNLQSSEKALKLEVGELKSQTNRQKAAIEKEIREKDKLKSQFANQKSVLESKVETLKSKLAKVANNPRSAGGSSALSNSSLRLSPNKSILPGNGFDSPSAPPSFSPARPRNSQYSSKTATSLLRGSAGSTTTATSIGNRPKSSIVSNNNFALPTPSIPGLKNRASDNHDNTTTFMTPDKKTGSEEKESTHITEKHPETGESVAESVDPLPIKLSVSKRKPRPSLQGETSFTATTKKGNKKISLFDDSDDEDVDGSSSTAVDEVSSDITKPKRKRKLKASVNLFDEDDPDNPGSKFKRVTGNNSIFSKEISPVKSRNDGIRKIFRID